MSIKLVEDEVSNHYLNEETRKRIFITEKYLEETYALDKVKPDNIVRSTAHYLKKNYKPSGNCKKLFNKSDKFEFPLNSSKKGMKNFLFKRLPIFNWLLNYDLKQYLVKDIIAGLTVRKLKQLKFKYFNLFVF